ncbi:protein TRIGALACTOSYLDIACYLGLYCEROL 4, chloroplastic [Macadamia integrifolia]|uniref:protein TRIGALACTOSYLDIACYLGLYCEROL 4, chloroplastic n=1 Tax=Macadamia integrifolia TaxID=60698 RepID=UPI001C5316A3|nr:protein TRIGALACTOSYLDIACYLGLYCEROL 4, chloroplastic [Macadamia integrifolia]
MRNLRWAMDAGFWDLDMSTPRVIDGVARPVLGDPLPLGLSRGTRLSRPKQIDFMQRFIYMPFVPSYVGDPASDSHGLSLQRVITFPFRENWFATALVQLNLQKLISSVKEWQSNNTMDSSWLRNIGRLLCSKSIYARGLCSEFLITPDTTVLVSSDIHGENKRPRNKAVFNHKFPWHDLTVEAVWPDLFVDKVGTYWDVPLLMTIDLASLPSDSGFSNHFTVHYNGGEPKQFDGDQIGQIPPTLLPGICAKHAFSIKKDVDIWRNKAGKLKMVQPYDIFLSDPHISASGIIGTVVTASFGDNSVRSQGKDAVLGPGGFSLYSPGKKSALLADLFASVSYTAQHGHFQRLFLDLTRLHARLDFLSGSKFIAGAARLAQDLYHSQPTNLEAVQAICPDVTLSLQQQIGGPFSVRVDSRLGLDLNNKGWNAHVHESVFAIEFALQDLGSAKALLWYSTKHREAMVELRFFET